MILIFQFSIFYTKQMLDTIYFCVQRVSEFAFSLLTGSSCLPRSIGGTVTNRGAKIQMDPQSFRTCAKVKRDMTLGRSACRAYTSWSAKINCEFKSHVYLDLIDSAIMAADDDDDQSREVTDFQLSHAHKLAMKISRVLQLFKM